MTARRTTIAVLAALICLVASQAQAVQAVWNNQCWWRDGRVAADLRLTRYELNQLERMHRGVEQREAYLRNTIEQARRSLDRNFDRGKAHRSTIERDIRAIEQASGELAVLDARHNLDVRRLLGDRRFHRAMRYISWQRPYRPYQPGGLVYMVTN